MKLLLKIMCLFVLAVNFLMVSEDIYAETKKKVIIVYVEWPDAVVSSNIVKAAIEERLGYEVELMPVSGAVMFQALASGEADATVTAALPIVHEAYMKRLGKNLEDAGVVATGLKLGLVVPDYVPIHSLAELKEHSSMFDGKIVGIDPGAGLMLATEKAMKTYGLDNYELVESTDGVMTAALGAAIAKKKPIVITGWTPHWIFERWNVRFLDDPKGAMGIPYDIHTVTRKGLKEEMLDVYNFFSKFSYTDRQQLQDEMAKNILDDANPLENAKLFLKDNKDQVDQWFK